MVHLNMDDEFKREPVAETQLTPELALLRTWQSERLSQTYADLLADDRYRPACLFFLSDLYAPRDFSQRDHDVERLHHLLSSILPPRVVHLLMDAIELTRLSNALDETLIDVLYKRLGVNGAIDAGQYAEAYRLCDNYAERLHQIDLLVSIMLEVGALAHSPMINVGLKLAGGFAGRLGWEEIYSFLQRGHEAFRHMRDVPFFAHTIEEREKQILQQIWDGTPEPFVIPSDSPQRSSPS